jgi:MinD-like ATPase involved in chromosome partitioning or flagellar assembly
MPKIVSIHSFRSGAGRSVITTNLAALMAAGGQRVAVIDTNLESPSLHILFGLPEDEITYSLNDYLWGRCASIQETLHDVTPRLNANLPGQLFLIPGSPDFLEMRRIIQHGYDVGLLNYGCYELIDKLGLDVLLIDTCPGLGAETLASITIAHTLALVLHLDNQDYPGTDVIINLTGKIEMPYRRLLIANEVPAVFDPEMVKTKLEKAFNLEVAAVLPYSEALITLTGAHIFVLNYPDHPITAVFKETAAKLVA